MLLLIPTSASLSLSTSVLRTLRCDPFASDSEATAYFHPENKSHLVPIAKEIKLTIERVALALNPLHLKTMKEATREEYRPFVINLDVNCQAFEIKFELSIFEITKFEKILSPGLVIHKLYPFFSIIFDHKIFNIEGGMGHPSIQSNPTDPQPLF